MDFEQKCKELCPYCRENEQPRYRADTQEFVHDVSMTVPGSIGKRQGHAFCTASNYRKEFGGRVE